jgi:hypothetical protein
MMARGDSGAATIPAYRIRHDVATAPTPARYVMNAATARGIITTALAEILALKRRHATRTAPLTRCGFATATAAWID